MVVIRYLKFSHKIHLDTFRYSGFESCYDYLQNVFTCLITKKLKLRLINLN